jgi:hypothetical protein
VAKAPVRFSQALADRICADLASGMTLREVCRQEAMPDPSAVIQWKNDDRCGFAQQYARAREAGYEIMADDLVEIADDGTNDYMQRETERGVEVLVDHDHVTRSRLRLDTRKWLLSKALPKIYGDKVQHTGANDAPLFPSIRVLFGDGKEPQDG